MASVRYSRKPVIKQLVMHVHVNGNRVYSGVVDRDESALAWIPRIISAASTHTGLNLQTHQTHPNDLEWTNTIVNRANEWTDSLKLEAFEK